MPGLSVVIQISAGSRDEANNKKENHLTINIFSNSSTNNHINGLFTLQPSPQLLFSSIKSNRFAGNSKDNFTCFNNKSAHFRTHSESSVLFLKIVQQSA